jgi:hypothetical protein
VDPSSLVFLAIIGVWAAYLVPTWLRRRVHFAQARARDRFSASARVLHRRSRSGLGGPSTAAVLTSPAVVAAEAVVDEVLPKHGARASRVGEADRARARSAQREAHIAHATAVERARLAAARRARVMVSLLLFSGAAWAVSLTTASPIWVSAPPSAMLLVHVMAARVAAVRSRRTLAVSRGRLAETRRRADAAVVAPAPVVEPVAASAAAPADPVEAPAAAVGDDTWVPVPVPPPTYTLKPVVPRPEPAPLSAPLPPAAASGRGRGALPRRPEEIERILDLDAAEDLETRRAVNG